MKLLKFLYEKITGETAPYYYNYSLWKVILKPIRKYFVNTLAANCPFNCIRILIYRIFGFKIGKKVFIGMKCYLDDMCYDLMEIGSGVTISYGVYFACHGKHQDHYPIVIEDGAYIGMRANVISRNRDKSDSGVRIGSNAVVGACTLVNCHVPSGATAVGVPCRILKTEEEVEPVRE